MMLLSLNLSSDQSCIESHQLRFPLYFVYVCNIVNFIKWRSVIHLDAYPVLDLEVGRVLFVLRSLTKLYTIVSDGIMQVWFIKWRLECFKIFLWWKRLSGSFYASKLSLRLFVQFFNYRRVVRVDQISCWVNMRHFQPKRLAFFVFSWLIS